MTSTNELTLSQSHQEDGGPLMYTVLYNGAPLMPSTTDKERAIAVLCKAADRMPGRAVAVRHWDGDAGTMRTVAPDYWAAIDGLVKTALAQF